MGARADSSPEYSHYLLLNLELGFVKLAFSLQLSVSSMIQAGDCTIPFETVEMIVSFLWHDPESLSHCTLVCRRWHTAVRPLIFRRVVVKGRERMVELESLLLEEPTVGYWIRELYIDGSSPDRSRRAWIFGPYPAADQLVFNGLDASSKTPNLHDPFPGPVLASRLRKLQALTFVQVHATHPRTSGALIAGLTKAFASSIRSLTFESCWGHEGFFLALMHALPLVNELRSIGTRTFEFGPHDWQIELESFRSTYLPFVSTCITPGSQPAEAHRNVRLTSLRLDHHDFVHDLGSMVCLQSLRTVQTLQINHTGSRLHPIDDISNKILPECGRTLRTLKLSITSLPPASHTKRFEVLWLPSFTHLKGLRTLELHLTPLHHPFVASLLDTCSSWCTKLSTLVLHFSHEPHMNPAIYFQLDRKFKVGGSMRALKEVRLRYVGKSAEEEVVQWAKTTFQTLRTSRAERGIVAIVEMPNGRVRLLE
ncbi:hypothetical protein EIP91_009998 [Steccherinum ochraceum]|uniref:F-box domain-containing protein n=1 Tax=Steccherinum ochraceum TaxID=92696 RepID=A0A4R0RZK3_9APHY|nr:hypothetical protein EIP91_009998 [Steccherinum ochraceum]